MGKATRRKHNAPRTKAGRISRAGRRDAGNDNAQDKHDKYGTDGSDPLGRAYRSGLLGEDGQRLMQTGRAIARAYWPMMGVGKIGCTLGTGGGGYSYGNLERERWLVATLSRIPSTKRLVFDSMVIDPWPDDGPAWLDRLIAKQGRGNDRAKLDTVIQVLEDLAS